MTGFDILALRALNAPELHCGMSRAEVAARLPAILARLNPSGGTGGAAPVQADGSWRQDIETALSPANNPTARIDTAARASRASQRFAAAHEDAALYAELALVEAEALDRLGEAAAADTLRLDSLPAARYGLGPDTIIGQMRRALAALGPAKEN